MLVVIFGAGASYDSVPGRYSDLMRGKAAWRPPLAVDLFKPRPGTFGPVMDRFHAGRALFMRVQDAVEHGISVEQAIQDLVDEIGKDELGVRQLTSLRFYLQEIIWDAGRVWAGTAFGQTNYVALTDEIERWRKPANERVAYVTFNYDLMLEDALEPFFKPRSFDDYRLGPTKLLKVHGSVDWGHKVVTPSGYAGGDLRSMLVDNAPSLIDTAEGWHRFRSFDKSTPAGSTGSNSFLYPALALPTTGKSGFECPDDHVAELRAAIRDMSKLLVIGWRGQEKHMLDVLREAANPVVGHVVTSQLESAHKLGNLISDVVPSFDGTAFGVGFSGYVAGATVRNLLAS